MKSTLQIKLNKAILFRYLFYKHFYKFMFLHKPLCKRYKENTLKIFNLYVCKSCLFLYTGFLITAFLTLIFLESVVFNFYFVLLISGLFLLLIISYPKIYSKFNRKIKDFIRFLNGVYLAIGIIAGFKLNIYAGFAMILSFIIFKNIYNKRRSGERICKGCTELSKGKTCAGYVKQKRALLKIDEEYADIVIKKGVEHD